MKTLSLLLLIGLIASCKPKANTDTRAKPVRVLPASYKISSSIKTRPTDTIQTDEQADAYADYYIVVADTGRNYDVLRGKMTDLNKSLNIPIDTMDRGYNKAKDLIAYPDNYADDDIYAGDYYPRRSISDFLSLEYLYVYKPGAKNKTIALVRGIYGTQASADSALLAMGESKTAFAFKGKVYVGCMH